MEKLSFNGTSRKFIGAEECIKQFFKTCNWSKDNFLKSFHLSTFYTASNLIQKWLSYENSNVIFFVFPLSVIQAFNFRVVRI